MRTLDVIPADLDRALRDAVMDVVGKYGGAIADIWRDVDHDGDDSVFVDVSYSRPDVPIDPSDLLVVRHRLRQVALDHGERAIVYVHNTFPRDQKIDEAAMDRVLTGRPSPGML